MDAHQLDGSSVAASHFGRCLLTGGVVIALLLPSGCVTPDPSIDLLEGELRWMEDQLYIMEDQLEQSCQELVACRASKSGQQCNCEESPTQHSKSRSRSNGEHRMRSYDRDDSFEIDSEPEETPGDDPGDSGKLPSPRGESFQNRQIPQLLESPGRERDRGEVGFDLDGADTLPPKVDLGGGGAANGDDGDDLDNIEGLLDEPEILLPEPEAAPRGVRPEVEFGSPEDTTSSVAPLILSDEVKQIQLNAARVSLSQKGVDQEKLLVVLEPQTGRHRYVEMSAPVRVILEDVDHGGVYFHSWEFSAVETGRSLRESQMGRGIHLALDWPDAVPLLESLRVSVAYRRIDGEEVRAQKIIRPEAQVTSLAGWIPVVRSHSVDEPNDSESSDSATGTLVDGTLVDPFAIAAHSRVDNRPQTFQTVPIQPKRSAAAADQPNVALATWSAPIPSHPTKTPSKRTPTSKVKLEAMDANAVGLDRPSPATEFGTTPTRAAATKALDSKQVLVEAAPPKKEKTDDILPVGGGSKWTPYR